MSDEVAYVVLLRVRLGQRVVPGSVTRRTNCGHLGWVAPTGQAYLESALGRGSYVICTSCLPPDTFTNPKAKSRSVPGAVAEIDRAFGTSEADQMRAFMRDAGIKPEG